MQGLQSPWLTFGLAALNLAQVVLLEFVRRGVYKTAGTSDELARHIAGDQLEAEGIATKAASADRRQVYGRPAPSEPRRPDG